jgi:2-aminoadipate transaminase
MQNVLLQGVAANTISLMIGHPDPTTLYTPEFRDAVNRVLAGPERALAYGPEQGYAVLIEYLVEKFNREQPISIRREQMMMVSGSTHAVDMIARLCGGTIIVEAPTYADSLHIFRDHGLELHSVPLDAEGIIVEELERLLEGLAEGPHPNPSPSGRGGEDHRAMILYTIPTFHNPMGVTLTAERRAEILRLAREYHVMIVEDDVYRDLSFGAPAPTPFFALAEDVNVLHIGSFSKTLAPGLRLGWLIGPDEMIQSFVNCGTTQMGGGASPFSSQIVAEYCRQGYWEAHVAELRHIYRSRRDVMLAALEEYMPVGVSWTKPAGGFFVWVTLPDQVRAVEVKRKALERGVLVAAGEGYFLNPEDGAHSLRLTYSFAPLKDIEKAVQILAEVVISLY